jgi:hypothetical protein
MYVHVYRQNDLPILWDACIVAIPVDAHILQSVCTKHLKVYEILQDAQKHCRLEGTTRIPRRKGQAYGKQSRETEGGQAMNLIRTEIMRCALLLNTSPKLHT